MLCERSLAVNCVRSAEILNPLHRRLKRPETLKPEQNFFPIVVPVQHDCIYPVWALSVLFIILWF